MNNSRTLWIALLAGGAAVMVLMVMNNPGPTKPGARPTGPATPTGAQPTTAAPQKTAAAAEAAAGSTTAPVPSSDSAPATAKASTKPRWMDDRVERPEKFVLGSLGPRSKPADRKNEYPFQVELTSQGAAIYTVKLRDYYATVKDKRFAERDWKAYEKALRDDLQNPRERRKYGGPYSLMNPVSDGGERHFPLATSQLHITFPDGKTRPWRNLGSLPWRHEPSLSKTHSDGRQTVAFSWTLCACRCGNPRAVRHRRTSKDEPVLKLIKIYTIRKGDYTIYVSLETKNLSADPLKIRLDQAGPTGVPREDYRTDMRRAGYGKLSTKDGRVQAIFKPRKGSADDVMKLRERIRTNQNNPESAGTSSNQDPTLWIGQINKFFGTMMYLVPAVEGRLQAPTWNAEFWVADALESPDSATHRTEIRIPKLALEPGQSRRVQFEVFAGPKRLDTFDDEKSAFFRKRYRDLDYISTIDLRSCLCSSDWLSYKMIQLLGLFAKVTFGNYGLAIMLLMVLVRVLLHPLTKKGQVMMSKMKKLGPMMKELEKKHGDDKEAMNRERVKLYKEQGATPLLGCLPMMLQMPILIALWSGINASIDLRHAAFLPVWIIDLAAPDRLITLSSPLPLIGTDINLLPLLLAAAMYWQMKLSPQAAQPGGSPEQEKQQKMMALMMPIMMPIMFYHMASGLTLYFLASTFFGAVEQQIIRRHIEAKEALAAAMQTTVSLPGKGPRGSRPKKPKGPIRYKRG